MRQIENATSDMEVAFSTATFEPTLASPNGTPRARVSTPTVRDGQKSHAQFEGSHSMSDSDTQPIMHDHDDDDQEPTPESQEGSGLLSDLDRAVRPVSNALERDPKSDEELAAERVRNNEDQAPS